ncbi:unnamed protein product, partial [Didymodactylos carnosus]
KFRDKYLIKQDMYDDIILTLRDGWGTAQFKFWVNKHFKLVKIGETNVVYGMKVNQPVVTYEQLFRKVKECHERVGHFGRDKTWAEVGFQKST